MDEETLLYAEEDREIRKQIEFPRSRFIVFDACTTKWQGTTAKNHNPHGEVLVADKIDLERKIEDLMGLEEITVSQEVDIVDDQENEWLDDWLKLKVEFDGKQQQSYKKDLKNLWVLG